MNDKKNKIINFLLSEKIIYGENIDLKTKTWIKRGGIANVWIQPENIEDFKKVIIWCQVNVIEFEVVGNTSNCYFLNTYNPLLVISTLKLRGISEKENNVICECGYQMSRLAKFCNSRGYVGYEGFIGLPGTVAGAVVNNSGCYGSLTSNILKEISILQNGEIKVLKNHQLECQHRSSALKLKKIKGVILTVTFDISKKEDAIRLSKKSKEFQRRRYLTQENKYPNLGTVFCILRFRHSLYQKFIRGSFSRLIHLILKNPVKQQIALVRLFWLLNPAGSFRRYVSKYSVQCFTWKDDGADQAFNEYVAFIKKNATEATMEIEIKQH
jgi:UDP-N-acetylmuramate dehydrogenase